MKRRVASYAAVGAFSVLLALFTAQIALDSVLRYLTDGQAPPEPIAANVFANPYLTLHAAAGVAALVLAPMQFVACIRERLPALHRAMGRLYVGACVVGAPTGLVLAAGTTAGPIAGSGFAILAILWALFTFFGVRFAMAGRLAEHRSWMIRSYAMAATAITLRLMLPSSAMLGLPFLPAYQAIAWLSWLTNLAVAELYLQRTVQRAAIAPKVATA